MYVNCECTKIRFIHHQLNKSYVSFISKYKPDATKKSNTVFNLIEIFVLEE